MTAPPTTTAMHHLSMGKRFLAWSLLVAWLCSTTGLASVKSADAIDGRLVHDPAAPDSDAIELWADHEANTQFSVDAGVYRLTTLGRFIGPHNTRYAVTVTAMHGGQKIAAQTLWPNQLPQDDKNHPLDMTLVLKSAGTLTLNLVLEDHAREEDKKAVEAERMQALAKAEAAALEDRDAGVDAENGDDIEDLDADRPPPAGTESYLLSSLSLERQQNTIAITWARPEKLYYYPNETAKLHYTLQNVTNTPAKGEVVVALYHELHERVEVRKHDVSLAAGESVAHELSHELSSLYGHEMRVTVSSGGSSHQAGDYFGVSDNVFELSIQGWDAGGIVGDLNTVREQLTMPEEKLRKTAEEIAEYARVRYYNHSENYAWARDDFFNLSPDVDVWWSGTGQYIKVKRLIQAKNKAMQAHGMKVLSYAQPFGIGIDWVEEFRANPEFFTYEPTGLPSIGYDYDLLKSRSRFDMGLRQTETSARLNMFNIRTIDRGIDAVIAAQKMFGWDGVRYDNRYYRANNPITHTGKRATTETDLDPYSARNVKRQKERFWKEIGPRFLISHNNGYNFYLDGNKLGWAETIKDGLMCMDEETCGANFPTSALNPMKAFIDFGTEARRFCTELGGYYQLFPPDRGSSMIVDMLYYAVACAASGSHSLTCDIEFSPAGHYGRFLTRYSQYVFARDIKPLANAADYAAFQVNGNPPFWWQEYANTLTEKGKRYVLLPVVVPPLKLRMTTNPGGLLHPTQAGVTMKLAADKFPRPPKVTLLSAERHLPMQSPLVVNDQLEVTLPRIAHFGLLVVESEVAP